MPRIRFYRYAVEGRGAFPVDMLRYDASYPERTEDALAIVVGRYDDGYGDVRQVRLITADNRMPTADRWISFGWRVVHSEAVR